MNTGRWILLGFGVFALMAIGLRPSEAGRRQAFLDGAEYPYTSRDVGCGCEVGR